MNYTLSAAFAIALAANTASAQMVLPTDVSKDGIEECAVSGIEFVNWFASPTHVQARALGRPADGFNPLFADSDKNTNCTFYKWGTQMFLWLTSNAPHGGMVFDGPDFYDVVSNTNSQSSYSLMFLPNSADAPNFMQLRTLKLDEIEEVGQAGGNDVLISQQKSLTYYGVHANDIFAEFLTGQKEGKFTDTEFPTTETEIDTIASTMGVSFEDPSAMTMELKTSWVDARTVGDTSRFITIEARVPKFNTSSDQTWTPMGSETLELALVGMHIAAPVNGHPEMVWATFEHVDTAPNAPYYYNSTSTDGIGFQPFDGAGSWIFFDGSSEMPAAVTPVASVVDGSIKAKSGSSIGPVNVAQLNPWGNAASDDSDRVRLSNSQLLLLNNDARMWLDSIADIRSNYVQVGAIWTKNGEMPSSSTREFFKGGLTLANSTMETFHQAAPGGTMSCFSCHTASSTADGLGISHIYKNLAPLSE